MFPSLPGLPGLSTWAVCAVLASLAAVALSFHEGRRRGFAAAFLVELAVVVVLGGWLSAKVAHVLLEARGHELGSGVVASGVVDLLQHDPWHGLRLFDAGWVFYGGVVGAVVIGLLFLHRAGERRVAALLDVATPGILLGVAVGRVGCFVGGCCYGSATALPWAVHFPAGHPTGGDGVHPVQLYDAGFAIVALLLWALLRHRPRRDGVVFVVGAAAYAVARFITELLRADADRGFVGPLSTSQVISIIVLALLALLAARVGRRR